MDTINTAKIETDADYRALYMKYLGTLKVLGEAAVHVSDRRPEAMDTRETIDMCMSDAAIFIEPRCKIFKRAMRYDLEPT